MSVTNSLNDYFKSCYCFYKSEYGDWGPCGIKGCSNCCGNKNAKNPLPIKIKLTTEERLARIERKLKIK